ncbi:MAG TPA: hypothetical protein VKV74_10300 [Bryobacteraceae bacterium]|nr:hypothetical protein [Bryobacteraceae bacterium]
MKKAGYYLCAPAVCLALFWRVLFTWFRTDDFAFLANASSVHDLPSLLRALFQPAAEGTVRVLADRLNYLTFYWLFGVAALPFHVWGLLIWFASLALAANIGARIAHSAAAGLVAALVWTTSAVMVTPLAWAAVNDMLLLSLLALAALYARIRWLDTGAGGWLALEWSFYLLGFGALETMVMYPAVAVLFTWAVARRDIGKKGERAVLLLFLAAAIFAAVHFLFIPNRGGETYRISVDSRLPATLWAYLKMAAGPERYGLQWALLPALALFAGWRLWRRGRAIWFCAGWFALWLAPLLLLPNHISEYYLTVPLAGLAWIAGWAAVCAWRSGWLARGGLAACLALYLAANLPEIRGGAAWYVERTSQMRRAFRAMQEAAFQHPGAMVIFKGVDANLFQTGFQDNPFPLAGVSRGFLAPGSDDVVARGDLQDFSKWTISKEDALRAIEDGKARVVDIEGHGPPHDITARYGAVIRAQLWAEGRDFVNVAWPDCSSRLGPSWYRVENGFRWMPKSATVVLAGPKSAGERLYVTGYSAAPALAAGPLALRFRVDGQDIGTIRLSEPNRPFQCDFALPDRFLGGYALTVSIEANRTFRAPGDGRELGMVFGTFSIR